MNTLEKILATVTKENDNIHSSVSFPNQELIEVATSFYNDVIKRLMSEFKKDAYKDLSAEKCLEIIEGEKTQFILQGIPYAPNIVLIEDVEEALDGNR